MMNNKDKDKKLSKAKLGEWIDREIFMRNDENFVIDEWQSACCSICGRYHTIPYAYYFWEDNYCPYCGAKMKKG